MSGESEGEKEGAGGDGDILAAVEFESDGRSVDGGAGLDVPEGLSRVSVEGNEVAFEISSEDKVPGCG